MAGKRISMKKIRDIIKLKHASDLIDRQIANELQVSRPLVKKYWEAFRKSGIMYDQVEAMTDSAFLQAIEEPIVKSDGKYQTLFEYFPDYYMELKKTGVTLQLLWEEYKQQHPEGYQYSQFCNHYQTWRSTSELTMHMNHRAGEKMFVDYAGNRLCIIDPVTGQELPVHLLCRQKRSDSRGKKPLPSGFFRKISSRRCNFPEVMTWG